MASNEIELGILNTATFRKDPDSFKDKINESPLSFECETDFKSNKKRVSPKLNKASDSESGSTSKQNVVGDNLVASELVVNDEKSVFDRISCQRNERVKNQSSKEVANITTTSRIPENFLLESIFDPNCNIRFKAKFSYSNPNSLFKNKSGYTLCEIAGEPFSVFLYSIDYFDVEPTITTEYRNSNNFQDKVPTNCMSNQKSEINVQPIPNSLEKNKILINGNNFEEITSSTFSLFKPNSKINNKQSKTLGYNSLSNNPKLFNDIKPNNDEMLTKFFRSVITTLQVKSNKKSNLLAMLMNIVSEHLIKPEFESILTDQFKRKISLTMSIIMRKRTYIVNYGSNNIVLTLDDAKKQTYDIVKLNMETIPNQASTPFPVLYALGNKEIKKNNFTRHSGTTLDETIITFYEVKSQKETVFSGIISSDLAKLLSSFEIESNISKLNLHNLAQSDSIVSSLLSSLHQKYISTSKKSTLGYVFAGFDGLFESDGRNQPKKFELRNKKFNVVRKTVEISKLLTRLKQINAEKMKNSIIKSLSIVNNTTHMIYRSICCCFKTSTTKITKELHFPN